ncbi:Fumarylacetoacetase [Fusarium acutatum]|uniref:fumarylacetoacetase n=1 Tax=Fusarium acutatum TaxID=78861 RepID=A0A8H4K060_9HYPO|nr:Fumarylacetoacetase [Fusarium acutatum]
MVQYPFPIPKASPFPISNIPFGIFHTEDNLDPRPGTAVGDHVLDLRILIQDGLPIDESVKEALESSSLNSFAALAPNVRNSLRKAIQEALRDQSSILYREDTGVIAADQVTMHVPMKIGGFTDFMCSLEHVQTMGHMAGYNEVPQNFFDLPAAYNGRASSVIVSGQNVTRPHGIIPGPNGATYAPSQRFDFELEMGVFISNPIKYGEPTPASRARDHVFGLVLLNDWSARDIQFYEMAPLGPFNGKATATSISPWIVTVEALEEAGALLTTKGLGLRGGKSTIIPFLRCQDDVAVRVSTSLSRNGVNEDLLGRSDLKHLHWSPFQMVAHHSSSGCGLDTGDLLGTGTLSSSTEQIKEFGSDHDPIRRSGCLAELVLGGTRPFILSNGSELVWLEDGDTVTMEGWAGSGDRAIGFGRSLKAPSRVQPVRDVAGKSRFSVTCIYPELADRRRLAARRESVRAEQSRPEAAPVTPESTELNVGAVRSPSVTPRIHSAGLVDVGTPRIDHAGSRSSDANVDDLPPRAIGLALLDIYFERFLRKPRHQPPSLGTHAVSPELAAFATYAGYGDAWAESARREAWLLTDRPTVQVVQTLSCLNLYWFATRNLDRARINVVMAYASATTFRSVNQSDSGTRTKDELQLVERKHGCFWACWSTMCISSFPEAYAKNAWEEACHVPLPVASDAFVTEGNVTHQYSMNVEWKPEALSDESYPPSSIMAEHMKLMGVCIDLLSILQTFWEPLEPMTRSLQRAADQILGPCDLVRHNIVGAEPKTIEVPMTGVNSPAREEDVITTTYIESPEYSNTQHSAISYTNAQFGVTDRAVEHVTQSMDETTDWHHNNLFEWCQTEGLLDIGDDFLDIGASVDWNMDLDLLTGFSSQMA